MTKFSLSDEPKHLDYDVSLNLNTPYWKNKFQDRYFIIDYNTPQWLDQKYRLLS